MARTGAFTQSTLAKVKSMKMEIENMKKPTPRQNMIIGGNTQLMTFDASKSFKWSFESFLMDSDSSEFELKIENIC